MKDCFTNLLWMGVLTCTVLTACDVVSLDPGDPEVSIKMDTTDFERSGMTGDAIVSFLIENRGIGTAYFEGCPDPVSMLVERVDGTWISHDELNSACDPPATPAQLALGGNKAYAYSYREGEAGHYRIVIFYGHAADAADTRSVMGDEFDVH